MSATTPASAPSQGLRSSPPSPPPQMPGAQPRTDSRWGEILERDVPFPVGQQGRVDGQARQAASEQVSGKGAAFDREAQQREMQRLLDLEGVTEEQKIAALLKEKEALLKQKAALEKEAALLKQQKKDFKNGQTLTTEEAKKIGMTPAIEKIAAARREKAAAKKALESHKARVKGKTAAVERLREQLAREDEEVKQMNEHTAKLQSDLRAAVAKVGDAERASGSFVSGGSSYVRGDGSRMSKAEEAKLLASDGTRMGKEELNAHLAKGGGLKITNGVVDVGGDGTKKHSRIGSN